MQPFKLFRPSQGPAKELCAHFETAISTSQNAQRGTEFHQIIAAILKGNELENVPLHFKQPVEYAIDLGRQLIDTPVAVEIEAPLMLDGEFVTSGTIDYWGEKELYPKPALKSRPSIIDWKTGQERDHWMQVSIYAVALLDSLYADPAPNTEIDLTLAFVDQEKHFTQTATYGQLRAKVDALIEDIRDPASPYSLNAYCGYCDLRGRCPAWDRERALVEGGNGDLRERLDVIRQDPVSLAKFLIALRRLNKLAENEELDKLAIKYLKEGKDVPGLNVVRNEGKPVYDKDALAQAIRLWVIENSGKEFPVSRTPYEYLKMTK